MQSVLVSAVRMLGRLMALAVESLYSRACHEGRAPIVSQSVRTAAEFCEIIVSLWTIIDQGSSYGPCILGSKPLPLPRGNGLPLKADAAEDRSSCKKKPPRLGTKAGLVLRSLKYS